jgi:hypothetical protein
MINTNKRTGWGARYSLATDTQQTYTFTAPKDEDAIGFTVVTNGQITPTNTAQCFITVTVNGIVVLDSCLNQQFGIKYFATKYYYGKIPANARIDVTVYNQSGQTVKGALNLLYQEGLEDLRYNFKNTVLYTDLENQGSVNRQPFRINAIGTKVFKSSLPLGRGNVKGIGFFMLGNYTTNDMLDADVTIQANGFPVLETWSFLNGAQGDNLNSLSRYYPCDIEDGSTLTYTLNSDVATSMEIVPFYLYGRD